MCLLGYFISKLLDFNASVNPIISDLAKFNIMSQDFGFDQSETLLEKCKVYKSTLQLSNNKTENKSSRYFNVDRLNSPDFNLPFFSSFSNTLIGLGIFFTFLGLTLGVGYFGYNLATTEGEQSQAISDGINVLMGGMGTAFASSVLGMLLSLVFSTIYKSKINSIDSSLNHICHELDSKYLKSESDFAEERDAKFFSMLEQSLEKANQNAEKRIPMILNAAKITYVDETNERVGLGTLTKELLLESKRQSDSLGTFSDDLADAFYDALNKGDENNGSIVQILREGFTKLLESEQQPINDLVNQLSLELNKTFNKMSDDITSSIEKLINNIESKAGGKVVEQANAAAIELNKVTGHIAQLPDILETLNAKTNQTTAFTREMIDKVNDVLVNLEKGIKKQQTAAQEVERATKIYADKRSEMNTSLDLIKNTSRSLEKSAVRIDEEFIKYQTHTEELELKRAQSLEFTSELVKQAGEMNTDLMSNLEVIKPGVDEIFKSISQGLERYHEQITNNASTEINTYSNAVVEITGSLQGIVDILKIEIEDLNNNLDRVNVRR